VNLGTHGQWPGALWTQYIHYSDENEDEDEDEDEEGCDEKE
jgi:hypothetical protein